MSLFGKYEKQLKKARIDKETADRIEHQFSNPSHAFSIIDNVFMKAKFSGLTRDQIVAIIDAGIFNDREFNANYLIQLKPYMQYWPDNPYFASLVYRAGISHNEVSAIGVENIHQDALETMIALK